MYLYKLTNSRRSDCPFCGKRGKYSAYVNVKTNELAPLEFGMCSSCQKFKLPPNNFIPGEHLQEEQQVLGYFEADKIDWKFYKDDYQPRSYIPNTLIDGLKVKFGWEQVQRVVDLYKLGCCESGAIMFPYLYTDNHLCTAKLMWFDDNLHRLKEGKRAYPAWLHKTISFLDYNETEDDDGNIIPFKLKLSLFGHNQIINDKEKTICLVESEKTAVIMSIVFPEFIWVAAGGKTMIQYYKFLFFVNRKCYAFPDLSEDDNVWFYWEEKLTGHNRKYGLDIQVLDYYQDYLQNDRELIQYCKTQKFDIADFVLYFNKDNRYVEYLKNKLEQIVK